MTLSHLVEPLGAKIHHRGRGFEATKLRTVIACDLMSDVLLHDGEDLLLVTSLATAQAVRTADIVGAIGIILVNGKEVSEAMRQLAREADITLLASPLDMFRACVTLGKELGLQ